MLRLDKRQLIFGSASLVGSALVPPALAQVASPGVDRGAWLDTWVANQKSGAVKPQVSTRPWRLPGPWSDYFAKKAQPDDSADQRDDADDAAFVLGRFADPIFFLVKVLRWNANNQAHAQGIEVPKGFVTDLASIPDIFFTFLRPDGLYAFPAIIHDFHYWEQKLPRDAADQIFRQCMYDFAVPGWQVEAIYRAVRFGGQQAWDRNAALKKAGEKRILRRFPRDPRIRWEEWRKVPGVFV